VKARGFTLIEILVALAIVAVALAAGMRALAQAADGSTALKSRTLALWVAQNVLARAELADPTPSLGATSGREHQAGSEFVWQASVLTTPNPGFRRIDIVVAAPDTPGYALATLTGYVGVRGAAP
jgi:general secretion pathway protein I